MQLLKPPIRRTIEEKQNRIIEELLSPNKSLCTNQKLLSHPYERGMLISISNYRMNWEDITKQYKRIYQLIFFNLTNQKISRDHIRKVIIIPARESIQELVYRKTPIVVCGIHDYKKEDQCKQYQHSHFYVYNVHHYLPKESLALKSRLDQLWSMLSCKRYTNSKYKKKDIIRITPVGNGKYLHTENISPTSLYDYLISPSVEPDKDSLINYISSNRHKPKVQYPLTSLYYSY